MRQPRHPVSAQPHPDHAAIEEACIIAGVRRWRAAMAEQLSNEASNQFFEDWFVEALEQPGADGLLFAATLARMAREGHGPADRALRRFIRVAGQTRSLDALPTAVLSYVDDITTRGPLPPTYAPRQPQTINHCLRDVMIGRMMRHIKALRPTTPLLHSTKRRKSAAFLVGAGFDLSEHQVRRIYQARDGASERLVDFLTVPVQHHHHPNEKIGLAG
jgi:hypothetical protein